MYQLRMSPATAKLFAEKMDDSGITNWLPRRIGHIVLKIDDQVVVTDGVPEYTLLYGVMKLEEAPDEVPGGNREPRGQS